MSVSFFNRTFSAQMLRGVAVLLLLAVALLNAEVSLPRF